MQSQTRRRLDGLLAIGPHLLDAQLRALASYAARTGHALDVFWTLLPGEDPATDVPRSGFPVVAFDDEIARFGPEEYEPSACADDSPGEETTVWHVAHATPQRKRPTTHLPVYGRAGSGETAADAILCIGRESLDRQISRIEAYAVRSAIRLRGVYIATDPDNLRALLGDFGASNRARGTDSTLAIGLRGEVEVHT
jgi:hypothetical protein